MRLAIAVVSIFAAIGVQPAGAQLCGDPSRDGRVTVSDGVDVLRASVGLSTGFPVSTRTAT
jgi:hypothetical protein